MRVRRLAALVGLVASPAAARAQDPLARAFDFERQGRWHEAAAAFRTVLARDPVNAPALLGAERVYTQLGQRDSILALVRRALALDSVSIPIRQIDVRTARAMRGEEGAADALRRWMAAAPRSEAPHRELTRALLSLGRPDDTRAAITQARALLGATVLQPEAAQLEALVGDWPRAAEEWRAAVARVPTMLTAALFSLQAAPPPHRDRLLRALTEPDTSRLGLRMAAELLLGWRDAPRAWTMLQRALPAEAPLRETALRSFADRARTQPGTASQRVAGEALERLAGMATGPAAARLRIESARAFWSAGEGEGARRVLRAIADDAASPADVMTSSVATLIEMYVRERNIAAAADLLAQRRAQLPRGEALRLGLVIARGWLARGELARAETAAASDSSLAGDEIRGWVALYRGQLEPARELLRVSAARAGAESAAERAAVVALLQAVESDSAPALGAALLVAARGDTAGSARALAALAGSTDPAFAADQARAGLLSLAAGFAQAAGDSAAADSLYRAITTRLPDTSPAPAAMLGLARLLRARGDHAGAVAQLESMILRYPHSALVPEARRELDRVRGLVPRS